MIKIIFHEDSDLVDVALATQEYQKIWNEEGQEIISAWENKTGLQFRETFINAIVFEGRGQSHPFCFRANLSSDMKKATLVHEIGHRILYKKIKLPEFSSLENHKNLDLCLYDILKDLYGKDFADVVVETEAKHPLYKEAWDWALLLSEKERRDKFAELLA